MFVQNIVTYGYTLLLKAFPASAFFNNDSSTFKHPNFVAQAIKELLHKHCIDEHDNAPHVVNPLTVAEGKHLRLVLDLRYIISLLESLHFKYEDLRMLSEIFSSGFHFLTFDLESGYHHVSIVQHHQQFLGFS